MTHTARYRAALARLDQSRYAHVSGVSIGGERLLRRLVKRREQQLGEPGPSCPSLKRGNCSCRVVHVRNAGVELGNRERKSLRVVGCRRYPGVLCERWADRKGL